jgi:cytochrome c oxidase cbb3-type subunit 4
METYSFLREFADTWMLVALFVFFVGVVLYVFRPGSRKLHQDTANIPFRHEDKPATDADMNTHEDAKEAQENGR